MKKCLLITFIAIFFSSDTIGQEIDSVVALYATKGIQIEVPDRFSIRKEVDHWADLMGRIDSVELMYKALEPPYGKPSVDGSNPSNDESLFGAITMATLKNLSTEEWPKLAPLPPEGVFNDFGADLGFICLFTPRSTVSAYKHAFIVCLHKSGSSDLFVMLLGNDVEKLKQVIPTMIFGKNRYL